MPQHKGIKEKCHKEYVVACKIAEKSMPQHAREHVVACNRRKKLVKHDKRRMPRHVNHI